MCYSLNGTMRPQTPLPRPHTPPIHPAPILSHNICVTQLFLGPTIYGTQYFVDQKFVNQLFFLPKSFGNHKFKNLLNK